jgi:hypothetical protein
MSKKSNARQKHRRFNKDLSEEEMLARLEIDALPLEEGFVEQRLDPHEPAYVDPLYLTYLQARKRQSKHKRTR